MADELVKVAEGSARGGFFLLSGSVLATVIMAIASIVIGNLLGQDLYGQYAIALDIPLLLFLFTDLGIGQGITKYTANFTAKGETTRLARMIKYALLLKAFAGILIFAINYTLAGLFASLLQRPYLTLYIQIASISVLFQVLSSIATSAFIGLDKTEYSALNTDIQALAKTIISITLVLLGFSVAGVMWGYTAGQAIGAIAGCLLLYLVFRGKQQSGDNDDVKKDIMALLRYGAPLYVAVLLGGLAQPYQTIILANFALDKDVGNLQVAQNFLSLLSVLPSPIVAALLPAFAKLDSSTTQKIKTFFKAATKYATMLVIPITILMMAYSGEIVHVIYPSYQTAGLLLATYCLLYFLVGLGYLTLGSLYNGLGDTKNTLIITLIGFITIIALSPVLTQAYSVQGMIAASIIAGTTGTIYGALKARQKYEIEFDMRSILKIYLNALASIVLPILLLYSGVIPAAVKPIIPSFLLHRLTFLPELIDLAIGAALYILIYLTLTPLTRTMTATELETVAHITKKTKLLAFIAKPFLKYQQIIIHLTTK